MIAFFGRIGVLDPDPVRQVTVREAIWARPGIDRSLHPLAPRVRRCLCCTGGLAEANSYLSGRSSSLAEAVPRNRLARLQVG